MPAPTEGAGVPARVLAAQVRDGLRSAREIAVEHLERARASASLGALWHVDDDQVLRSADLVDRCRARGEDPGALAGVPVVVKDGFAVRGLPRSGGVGEPRVDGRDAAAVGKLRRAGAVVLGKAAMHQLAWATSGQCPGAPAVLNPRRRDRQPGGSSSGSAVAVAAAIAPVALGSDTAGSVRVPAAWCGVVGYKPRQAAVSRAGLQPLAPTFDAVGWLTGGVADAAAVADVLIRRARTAARTPARVRVQADAAALDAAEPSHRAAALEALGALEAGGMDCRVADPGLPSLRVGPMFAVEFAASWESLDPGEPGLGDDVRDGLRAGARVPALDYLRAQAAVRIARRTAALDADVLLLPATPAGPPPLDAPDDVAAATRFTRMFNALDWPALVVPVDPDASTAVQLAAPRGRESALWAVAEAVERSVESRA
jgi:Asp-tRNA(Asn)/Glu-tRNA(Gln) amidotransferase A subunit family amidase